MIQHTPGPWTAKRCTHGWHIGPQPDGICTIRDNTDGSDAAEHLANARLIAAAPELLAAAEEFIKAYENLKIMALAKLEVVIARVQP